MLTQDIIAFGALAVILYLLATRNPYRLTDIRKGSIVSYSLTKYRVEEVIRGSNGLRHWIEAHLTNRDGHEVYLRYELNTNEVFVRNRELPKLDWRPGLVYLQLACSRWLRLLKRTSKAVPLAGYGSFHYFYGGETQQPEPNAPEVLTSWDFHILVSVDRRRLFILEQKASGEAWFREYIMSRVEPAHFEVIRR